MKSADNRLLLWSSLTAFCSNNRQMKTADDRLLLWSELIIQIIQNQWFQSSSHIQSDSKAMSQVYKDEAIPPNMVLLTVMAVSGGVI